MKIHVQNLIKLDEVICNNTQIWCIEANLGFEYTALAHSLWGTSVYAINYMDPLVGTSNISGCTK